MLVGDFKALDIGMRMQRKLLGKMSNKGMAKMFIDDISANLLDNIYKFAKMNTDTKKEAEKVMKNIIKVSYR